MRPIEFRAWDNIAKQMRAGVYFNGKWWCYTGHIGGTFGIDGAIKIGSTDGKDRIMQYTGLKDKNGKKIFEGDRIKYSTSIESGIGVIETFGKCNNLGILWEHQDTENPGIFSPLFYFQCESELEVIGNIHEKQGE